MGGYKRQSLILCNCLVQAQMHTYIFVYLCAGENMMFIITLPSVTHHIIKQEIMSFTGEADIG